MEGAAGLGAIQRAGSRIGSNGRPCSAKVMITILQLIGKQNGALKVLAVLVPDLIRKADQEVAGSGIAGLIGDQNVDTGRTC